MAECGWDTLGHTCDNQAQGWFTNCSLADVPGVGAAPAPRDYLFGAVAVIPEQSFREMGPAILPNDIPIPRGGWLGLILGSGNSSLEPPSLGPRRQDRAARRGVKDQPRRCRVSAETDSSIISRAAHLLRAGEGTRTPNPFITSEVRCQLRHAGQGVAHGSGIAARARIDVHRSTSDDLASADILIRWRPHRCAW